MKVRKWISSLLVLVLVSSALAAPSVAQESPPGDQPPVERNQDGDFELDEGLADTPPDPVVDSPFEAAAAAVERPAPVRPAPDGGTRSGWKPGRAETTVRAGAVARVGSTPVSVKVADNAPNRQREVVARVNIVPADIAGQLSPFGAALAIDFVDAAGTDRSPSGAYELTFDLSEVNLGSAADRLSLTRYVDCEVFEPDLSAFEADGVVLSAEEAAALPGRVTCGDSEEIEATFDVAGDELTVTIDESGVAASMSARRRALLSSGLSAADLDPKSGLSRADAVEQDRIAATGRSGRALGVESTTSGVTTETVSPEVVSAGLGSAVAVSGSGSTMMGVTSGSSSSSGDFGGLPVPTLTESQVGLYTGSAELSYPIPGAPAAAGPSPSMALVYSSGGVDGQVMTTNNQAGLFGVGWSLAGAGSISRGLTGCDDPAAAEDRCISSAPQEVYTLTLAGRSSKLVRTGAGTGYTEFRLQDDTSWRVRLNVGGSANGSVVSTPDHRNEWWSVESSDGTVFTLGSQTESVDWVPVWYPTGGCTAQYALCDTAYKWNIDTVTDVFGNQMTYDWDQESNWYNARGISTAYSREYIRSSNLRAVEYGANPGLSNPANARIVFDYEARCGYTSEFGDCEWGSATVPTEFLDTPTDLWCGPSTGAIYPTICDEQGPTFWTQLQFTGALGQVGDGAGGWVTVAHHDPIQGFDRDDDASELDSTSQLALHRMQERAVDQTVGAGGEYSRFGFNRQLASDYDGQSGVTLTALGHDVGSNTAVTSVKSGDWVRFDDVWLGEAGAASKTVALRYSAFGAGTIEIRRGSPTGVVLATLNVTGSAADRYKFDTAVLTLTSNQSGVHDIFIRAAGGGSQDFTLWQSIQFGRNEVEALGEVATVDFESGGFDYRDNRLNSPSGVSAMRFPRIKKVTNQLGGTTTYTYGQDLTCIGQSTPINGSWDLNDRDCFPQWDSSSLPAGYVIFHKWPVQTMVRDGSVSSGGYSPDVVTNYAYQSAGWGFADNPDSSDDTWNDFRGYNIVTVTDSAGKSEYRFHQGLHAEPTAGGGVANVSVARSDLTNIQDDFALRGKTYEMRRLSTSGAQFSSDWTLYANTNTVPWLAARDDPRFVAADQLDRSLDGGTTTTLLGYNTWGQPTFVNEKGKAGTADDRTTVSSYYKATGSATLGAWRAPQPCVTAIRSGNSTAAPSSASAAGFNRYSRDFYDGTTSGACNTVTVDEPVATRNKLAYADQSFLISNYRVDNRGRVDRVTDPENNNTTLVFDGLHGQVTTTTNPLAWGSSVGYDSWRRPVTTTDVNGRDTTTVFDVYSRMTSQVAPADTAANPTVKVIYGETARPAWVKTQSRLTGSSYSDAAEFFDGFGNGILARRTAPATNQNWATATSYDSTGRAFRSSASYFINGNNVAQFAYPSWGTMPSFSEQSYDSMSRPFNSFTRKGVGGTISTLFTTKSRYTPFATSFWDRKNFRTNTTVDGLGRTTEVKELSLSNLTTSYTYNSVGDLLTVNGPDNFVTTNTFDIAGRKLSMDDPDTGDWSYTYTANSQLKTQNDPSGTVLTFAYDALDRPTSRKNGTTVLAEWFYDPTTPTFGFDNRGAVERTAAYSPEGTVQQLYTYDVLGRVLTETTDIPRTHSAGTYKFTSAYTYRDDDQVATLRYPVNGGGGLGTTATYTYSNRTGLATDLHSSSDGKIVDDVTWNQAGQLRTRLYGPAGADGVADFRYDPYSLRMTQNRGGTVANTQQWQKLYYWYDASGNISRIRDFKNQSQRQCFFYDALDRLITAYTDDANCDGYTAKGVGNFNDSYTYRAGGNLKTKTGNGTYFYADADHRHAVTSTSNGSSFAYDDDGNMTDRDLAGQPDQTLTWDVDQRLSSVSIAGGSTTSFLYDADGKRVRRKIGAAGTYYSANSEFDWDGTGTQVWTAWFTIGGDRVAYRDGSTLTWIYGDQVGSTTLTRTEAGANRRQRYTPWGELRTNANLTTDRHYTGQIADLETGLAFYNARYYDPVVGQFTAADTIVANPNDGQNLNRYSYVGNNPVNYNDPSGRCFDLCPPVVQDIETIKAGYRADGFKAVVPQGNTYSANVTTDSGSFTVSVDSDGNASYTGWSTDRPTAQFADATDYILSEMNAHDDFHIPVVGDVANGWRFRKGGSWDHKGDIEDRWSDKVSITVDGEDWIVSYDMFSNIHYGYVNFEASSFPSSWWNKGADAGNLPLIGPAVLRPLFVGYNNPLDTAYSEFGGSVAKAIDGDVSRSAFDAMLQPMLVEWSNNADFGKFTPPRRG